jgi:SAM-dependent methyltransferase
MFRTVAPDRDRPNLHAHATAVIRDMSSYDMVTHPDEAYYADQYLHWIFHDLENHFSDQQVRILDLGCGQGRLSLPLAQWCSVAGGVVAGVDLTPSAVQRAQENAAARKLGNVVFRVSDVLAFLRSQPDESADIVLLTEVTFFLPFCDEVLREIARVLRFGGVLFASFRSQFFNLLQTIRARLWESAEMAVAHREGHLFGKPVWFTWQTPEDVERLLDDAGFRTRYLRGIGVCSGVKDDPLAHVAQPSRLTQDERARLMKIECESAELHASCGRYILATAEKKIASHVGASND